MFTLIRILFESVAIHLKVVTNAISADKWLYFGFGAVFLLVHTFAD